MRVLTLLQPFAWLVVSGLKTVEHRSWKTSFRGRVLIHASKSTRRLCEPLPPGSPPRGELARGAIVGAVVIVACHSYGQRRFRWLLSDPVAFAEPIPCLGTLGLWALPESLQRAVRKALRGK